MFCRQNTLPAASRSWFLGNMFRSAYKTTYSVLHYLSPLWQTFLAILHGSSFWTWISDSMLSPAALAQLEGADWLQTLPSAVVCRDAGAQTIWPFLALLFLQYSLQRRLYNSLLSKDPLLFIACSQPEFSLSLPFSMERHSQFKKHRRTSVDNMPNF